MTSSNTDTVSAKISVPAMVYISGEEMTREVMKLILEQWIDPYLDTKNWQFYDLSCKARNDSNDQVLTDTIEAGAKIGAIFKEPTITPTAEQCKEMGLETALGSPNGKMRSAWNGFSIDRDTIVIEGLEKQMGYAKPVLFCRHAVGGRYGAGSAMVGPGMLELTHIAEDGTRKVVNTRPLTDKLNAAVVYHNPYDNVEKLAHHFFQRSLDAGVTPYIVTKKTVFKWQEHFWQAMKDVFDNNYKDQFLSKGLLKSTDGELRHLLSDDAVMKMAKWREGGFSMVSHNYDGDVLSDLLAEIYKSPGFISSVLTGMNKDGQKIMEFEASHGTIADQYHAHIAGKETSVNPLGMVYALRGAIDHSANLGLDNGHIDENTCTMIKTFTKIMYQSMCEAMASGKGTRDLSGSSGLTTEQFTQEVASRLAQKVEQTLSKKVA